MNRAEAIDELIDLFGGIPPADRVDDTTFRYRVSQVLLEHAEYWIHISVSHVEETVKDGFDRARKAVREEPVES